jgi:hypothetical protein
LTSRELKYEDLKEAIRIALEGDEEIVSLYDPNIEVNSIEDVVNDIYKKLFEISDFCVCKGIYEDEKLIGYYAYIEKMLISFSVSSPNRMKKSLHQFFELIQKDLGDQFVCRLWSKNLRAIKWLIKNGFQFVDDENQITRLIYLK